MRKYQNQGAAALAAPIEEAEPLRVVVVVNAGVVEAVYCTDKAAQVDVIDHDNMTAESDAARDMLSELWEAQAIHMVY